MKSLNQSNCWTCREFWNIEKIILGCGFNFYRDILLLHLCFFFNFVPHYNFLMTPRSKLTLGCESHGIELATHYAAGYLATAPTYRIALLWYYDETWQMTDVTRKQSTDDVTNHISHMLGLHANIHGWMKQELLRKAW